MRFSRKDIYECELSRNAYVFENMDDYLTMLALSTKTMAQALSRSAGINTLQYRILSIVHRERSSTVSRLAQELAVRSSTISSAISALSDLMLIQRKEESSDRRAILLSLTPKGRSALKSAHKAVASSAGEASAFLSPDQAQALIAASVHVIEAHPSQSFATTSDDPSLIVANATFITKKLLGARLKELGLIPRDYRVMLAIENMKQTATSGAIADYLLLKPSDITSCLNNLSALRYITRERCARNRRQREVKLTETGLENLRTLTPQVFDALYEAGPSNDEMIQVLIETASALVRAQRSSSQSRLAPA